MPIRFRCPSCAALMAISRREVGHLVECPKCGNEITVPPLDIAAPKIETPLVETPAAPERPAAERTVAERTVQKQESEREPQFDAPPRDVANADHDRLRPALDSSHADEEEVESEEAESVPPDDEPFVPAEIGEDDGTEGPLTFHRKNIVADDMDLTPMVDVTFQLLIFFMVSASFSLQKSIEVPTPDPDQKGATQQVKTLEDLQGTSILVKIDASNGIWIDDEPLPDAGRLADTLRDKMRREQKTELLISAQAHSMHRTVIAVIDAANEIGVQKIRMASQKKVE